MKSQERRALISGLLGNSIEFYEFAVYGLAAALVFNEVFFPDFSSAAGTLLSMATFAVAFIARPLGAVVFGHFGDKVGRKKMLLIALLLMGGSTVCIGLLPTYGQVGFLAPIFLVVLRLIQGFSLGGELSGAVLMSLEHANPNRRGFIGALIASGLGWGTLLANAVFLLINQLPEDQLLSWGWRIPFLSSAILLIVCLYIRLGLEESPEFKVVKKAKTVTKLPLVEVLRSHGWKVLGIALMMPGSGVLYFLATVYSLSYAKTEGIDRNTVLIALLIVNVVLIVATPLWGLLGDLYSRRKILLFSFVGMAAATWIWVPMLNTNVPMWIILGFVLLFIAHTANHASLPTTFAHVFPAEVRYTGLAMGYNFGTLIGGAMSPIVAAAMLSSTGSWIPIALYMTAASTVSLIAAVFVRERYVGMQTDTVAHKNDDTQDRDTIGEFVAGVR